MDRITYSQQSKSIDNLFKAILKHQADHKETSGSDLSAVKDTSDKFELWEANSGSTHPPESKLSLEGRLENAPQLRKELHELLNSIKEALRDAVEIIEGNRENRLIVKKEYGEVDQESADSEKIEQSSVTIKTTELADLLGIASDTIGSLLKLIRLIRKATSRDRHSRALQIQQDPFMHRFDINYVRERYPKLSLRQETEWLIEHLGRAITMRRQFLRYFREHKERLATSPNDEVQVAETSPVTEEPGLPHSPSAVNAPASERQTQNDDSTKATTLANTQLDSSRSKDVALLLDDPDGGSYVSETTSVTAPSALNIPRLEDFKQKNESFECPLCCKLLSVKNERAWKRHVHEDLKSYVCCFGEGQCHVKLFGSQREWFDHELEHHRQEWICSICQEGPFSRPHIFHVHLADAHPEYQFSEEAMEALTVAGQRPVEFILARECPFCDDWHIRLLESQPSGNRGKSASSKIQGDDVAVTTINFRRHVAIHLQQLALFAIPRGIFDPRGSVVESNDTQEPRSSSRTLPSIAEGFESPTQPSISYSNEEEGLTKPVPGEPLLQVRSGAFPEGEQEMDPTTVSSPDTKGKQIDTNKHESELNTEPEYEISIPKDQPKTPKGSRKWRSTFAKSARGSKSRHEKLEIWLCCQCRTENPVASDSTCTSCHDHYQCADCTVQTILLPG